MLQFELPPEAQQELVSILRNYCPQCSVFVFGYRDKETTGSVGLFTKGHETPALPHFDLLVFVKKMAYYKGVDIANSIAEQSDRRLSATVLLHNITALQIEKQQYFFDQVLRHGQRIALDKANVPYILNPNPQRDLETDTRFWHKCVAVAQFNLAAAKESGHLDVELCKIAFLHTASVQIALGLIRVFIGYIPNEVGLNHLLKICEHFTDIPPLIFNQQTPEAKRRYKMLCALPTMLNHWLKLDARETDFLWLLDACEQFLDEARKLAQQKIETSNP